MNVRTHCCGQRDIMPREKRWTMTGASGRFPAIEFPAPKTGRSNTTMTTTTKTTEDHDDDDAGSRRGGLPECFGCFIRRAIISNYRLFIGHDTIAALSQYRISRKCDVTRWRRRIASSSWSSWPGHNDERPRTVLRVKSRCSHTARVYSVV